MDALNPLPSLDISTNVEQRAILRAGVANEVIVVTLVLNLMIGILVATESTWYLALLFLNIYTFAEYTHYLVRLHITPTQVMITTPLDVRVLSTDAIKSVHVRRWYNGVITLSFRLTNQKLPIIYHLNPHLVREIAPMQLYSLLRGIFADSARQAELDKGGSLTGRSS